MHVTERLHGQTLILTISGRLTFYSRKMFQALVNTATLSGARHIIFDLNGVTFLDSSALGCLVLAYLKLQQGGIVMSLVGPQPHLQSLMESWDFPELVAMYPTAEGALNAALDS
jgi:anti-anti-sigma factor